MRAWLADSLSELQRAPAGPAIVQSVSRQLGQFGISGAIYVERTAQGVWSSSNLPRWWGEEYRKRGLGRVDPYLTHCCSSYRHTFTGARFLGRHPFLTPEERRFVESAQDAGLFAGVAVPTALQGEATTGGWNVGGDLSRRDLEAIWAEREAEIRALLLHAHAKLTQPRRNLVPGRAPSWRRLSPREKDCLRHLADGLLTSGIGQRLGISSSTVEFHLRNARHKLESETREQALARALTAGLL